MQGNCNSLSIFIFNGVCSTLRIFSILIDFSVIDVLIKVTAASEMDIQESVCLETETCQEKSSTEEMQVTFLEDNAFLCSEKEKSTTIVDPFKEVDESSIVALPGTPAHRLTGSPPPCEANASSPVFFMMCSQRDSTSLPSTVELTCESESVDSTTSVSNTKSTYLFQVCKSCNIMLPSLVELSDHVKEYHKSVKVLCSCCEVECPSFEDLRIHMLKDHSSGSWEQYKLKKLFKLDFILNIKLKTGKFKKYICCFCNCKLKSLVHLCYHYSKDHINQICRSCQVYFPSRLENFEHGKIHESITDKLPITCPLCIFNCSTYDQLCTHYKFSHPTKMRKCKHCYNVLCSSQRSNVCWSCQVEPKVATSHHCQFCLKSLDLLSEVPHHYIRSHANQQYVCKCCNNTYEGFRAFEEHIIKKNKQTFDSIIIVKLKLAQIFKLIDVKFFSCEFCTFAIGDLDMLQDHVKKLHHICHVCSIYFSSELSYSEHMQRHIDKTVPLLRCTLCTEVYFDMEAKHRCAEQEDRDLSGQIIVEEIVNLPVQAVDCPYCALHGVEMAPSKIAAHVRKHQSVTCFSCENKIIVFSCTSLGPTLYDTRKCLDCINNVSPTTQTQLNASTTTEPPNMKKGSQQSNALEELDERSLLDRLKDRSTSSNMKKVSQQSNALEELDERSLLDRLTSSDENSVFEKQGTELKTKDIQRLQRRPPTVSSVIHKKMCTQCFMQLNTFTEMCTHINAEHGDVKYKFLSNIYVLSLLNDLTSHLSTATNPTDQDEIHMINFYSSLHLVDDILDYVKGSKCLFCDCIFLTYLGLASHLRDKHFFCRACRIFLPSKNSFLHHVRAHLRKELMRCNCKECAKLHGSNNKTEVKYLTVNEPDSRTFCPLCLANLSHEEISKVRLQHGHVKIRCKSCDNHSIYHVKNDQNIHQSCLECINSVPIDTVAAGQEKYNSLIVLYESVTSPSVNTKDPSSLFSATELSVVCEAPAISQGPIEEEPKTTSLLADESRGALARCNLCPAVLQNVDSVIIHISEIHSYISTCEMCPHLPQFNNLRQYCEHLCTHYSKDIVIRVMLFSLKQKQVIRDAKEESTAMRALCLLCGMTCADISDLQSHVEKDHQCFCIDCGVLFRDVCAYLDHQEMHSSMRLSCKFCNLCGLRCRSFSDTVHHILHHHRDKQKTLATFRNFSGQLAQDKSKLPTGLCFYPYCTVRSADMLLAHANCKHQVNTCVQCSNVFVTNARVPENDKCHLCS